MTIVIRPSCWHKNFGPNGLSAPTLGLCLNFFSSITADFNTSAMSDTGPMVLCFFHAVAHMVCKANLHTFYMTPKFVWQYDHAGAWTQNLCLDLWSQVTHSEKCLAVASTSIFGISNLVICSLANNLISSTNEKKKLHEINHPSKWPVYTHKDWSACASA